MKTFGDIKDEVLVRGQISTTVGFHTDTSVNDHLDHAHVWASSYKKWPFTEGRVSTTYASTEEWSFEGYKADSFRILQIGGKRLTKLNFEDYQIFREEEPSADDRVFSDFGRLVFINPSSGLSGTLTAWGQYQPAAWDTTDLTATTVFSNFDDEGNEAIVNEALSYVKTREQNLNEANAYHEKAKQILDGVWNRVQAEQYAYQTHPDRGGMFKRFDVLRGNEVEELRLEDQF